MNQLDRFPAEFRLALACCRWPPSVERNDRIRQAALGVNWPLFGRVAKRHRIEGLIWEALSRAGVVPQIGVAHELSVAAHRIAGNNLQAASEAAKLEQALQNAEVPSIALKGNALGMIAYKSISLKQGWDIDILVCPESLEKATMVLMDAGYEIAIPAPPFDAKRIRSWHVHNKESLWRNDKLCTFVELHTRITNNPRLLPGIGMLSPTQRVELATGLHITIFEKEELFVYLCVHGASSAWFRLKWLADLAAILSECTPSDISRLHSIAHKFGCGRASAQALLLVHVLLGVELEKGLRQSLWSNAINRLLFHTAIRTLFGRFLADELSDVPFGTMPIHLMQFLLLPSWKFKWAELKQQSLSLPRLGAYLRQALHAW